MKNSPVERWNLAIRVLHWLTVIVLTAQFGIAFVLMGGAGMATIVWLPLHMSLGAIILGIIVLRLGWRAFARPPVRHMSWRLRRLRIFIQANLYALILVVTATGWMAYRPMPLTPAARLFDSIPVPLAPNVSGLSARDFATAHSILVWVLLAAIVVHVTAVLTHACVLRDGTMRTMLFGRSGTPDNRVE